MKGYLPWDSHALALNPRHASQLPLPWLSILLHLLESDNLFAGTHLLPLLQLFLVKNLFKLLNKIITPSSKYNKKYICHGSSNPYLYVPFTLLLCVKGFMGGHQC